MPDSLVLAFGVAMLCAVFALSALAWFLISVGEKVARLMEALLPQSQALQSLGKLGEANDARLKALFAKAESSPNAQAPTLASQLDALKKKAEAAGFNVEQPTIEQNYTVVPPQPDRINRKLQWDDVIE